MPGLGMAPMTIRAECNKSDAAAAAGISVKVEGFGQVVPGVRPQTKPDEIE
jgi:hypothetical protein